MHPYGLLSHVVTPDECHGVSRTLDDVERYVRGIRDREYNLFVHTGTVSLGYACYKYTDWQAQRKMKDG